MNWPTSVRVRWMSVEPMNIEVVKNRVGDFVVRRKVTDASELYNRAQKGWFEYWNGRGCDPGDFSLATFGDDFATPFKSEVEAKTAFLVAKMIS